MTKKFDDYVMEVAARTMRDGDSASKPSTGKFLPARDVWSFPKYPSRTAILPHTVDLVSELLQFILRNEAELNEDDCWLGTWIHPHTREFYLDVATGVTDLEEARNTAMQVSAADGRRIVAMFNAKRGETVFL